MCRRGSTEVNMRIRPRQNGSWLFPVMVVAAASAVAFGCLGLAFITGHLRTAPGHAPAGDALVTAEGPGTPKTMPRAANDPSAALAGGVGHN
jgi:hypothetical protein